MKKIFSSNIVIYLLLIIIGIPVILPYFHKGYFPTHDGEWAVVRASEMFREIRDLQFPARFSGNLNFGYGYPLFNFAYPMPYYVGVILHFLKFGFIDSIKFLFAVSVPLSSIFMYLASKELWKSKAAAFLSSIFYIYLPYRFIDLYVRGSLGESISFILFPLIFYSVLKIINKSSNTKLFIALGAFSFAFLVTTHNIMATLFSFSLFLFLFGYIVLFKKTEIISKIIILILFGLGLSGFFWIPALFEKSNILLSVTPIADRNLYFTNLQQFVLPKWGYGVPTENGGFSYQLGLPQLIVLILSAFFLTYVLSKKKKIFTEEYFKHSLILILILLFFIFLMFPQSAVFWKLPLLSEINYPWTNLAIIGFLISLISGFLVVKNNNAKYVIVLLAGTSIFMFLPYAKPQYYVDRGDSFYLTNDATTTSSRELMPLWVKKLPNKRAENKIEILKGKGEYNNLIYNSKKITFNFDAKEDAKIKINTIYYPGWKAYVDGNQSNIKYDNNQGVMELSIPKGNQSVKLLFSETPLRLFADILSVVSLISLVVYSRIFFAKKIKKRYYSL